MLLDHALAAVECRVISDLDMGTHAIFAGEVIKGRVPTTAPTYREYATEDTP